MADLSPVHSGVRHVWNSSDHGGDPGKVGRSDRMVRLVLAHFGRNCKNDSRVGESVI